MEFRKVHRHITELTSQTQANLLLVLQGLADGIDPAGLQRVVAPSQVLDRIPPAQGSGPFKDQEPPGRLRDQPLPSGSISCSTNLVQTSPR